MTGIEMLSIYIGSIVVVLFALFNDSEEGYRLHEVTVATIVGRILLALVPFFNTGLAAMFLIVSILNGIHNTVIYIGKFKIWGKVPFAPKPIINSKDEL